jgi:carbon-monoxide dehydrogenase large subunit
MGERDSQDRTDRQGDGVDGRIAARARRRDHVRADRSRRTGRGIDDVLVLHGDTSIVQYGIGTFGSRGTAVGGTAMYFALQDLKAKIKKFGEMLLDSDDVTFSGGLCIDNKTGATKSLQEIAAASYRAMRLPPNTEPGMVSTHFWEPPNFTFPFGAHMVVTDIDRDTGAISIRRYIAVDDCGNLLNPLIVDGQVHGGVAQGWGKRCGSKRCTTTTASC